MQFANWKSESEHWSKTPNKRVRIRRCVMPAACVLIAPALASRLTGRLLESKETVRTVYRQGHAEIGALIRYGVCQRPVGGENTIRRESYGLD